MQSLLVIVAAVLGAATLRAHAAVLDVGTCEEFKAVSRKTEAEVAITTADLSCDEYTRLSVRSDMVLKSSVGKVTFSNLALMVYGSLTVEPDVVFTGITLVEKSGGALKLDLGAVSVFQGTVEFIENSISSTDTHPGTFVYSEHKRKGGAIHNKGSLTFEKDAIFTGNHNDGVEQSSGPGGAISVHSKGSIYFKGDLIMTDNYADDYYGGAHGGAIYNRGDIVVDGQANFSENTGGRGGAIYQEERATFVFNNFATFTSNTCYDTYGGAIANFGGDVICNAGSSFYDGLAANSGDGGDGGGIYNYDGGVITLKGPTSFIENRANYGGAIFNRVSNTIDDDYQAPQITYPDDTVFENNDGEYCTDVAYSYDEETCGL